MQMQDLLGYAAACLTTVSFAPQAFKTFRTRDVSGISLPMYTIFTAGVATWLAYGIASGDMPVLVANAVTLALAAAVLAMKIRWQHDSPPDKSAGGKRQAAASGPRT